MFRTACLSFTALVLTTLSAPSLASDEAEVEALANQMIALCDGALGPQGLEGVADEIGVALAPFDFPVAERDITVSEQILALPDTEGLSVWTGQREGEGVCVMGAQDNNLRVVREAEARLRAAGRPVIHNTVNVSFGLFRRGNSVRVVELAAER